MLELITAIPQNAEADRLRNPKDAQRLAEEKCTDLDKARVLAETKAEGERKRADKEREMRLAAEGNAEKKVECERKRADEEREMRLAAEAKAESLEREMREMRAKLKMQEIV